MTDWTPWLGPAADQMTPEQRARFDAEAPEILALWPDKLDGADERDAALSALVQYLLGEITLDVAGEQRDRTRHAGWMAYVQAQVIARLAVQDGATEADAARRARIDRMIVRRALGK